jgi:vesicle-fusing ATPase
MASRFGFQSTTMIVTNTPAADLALTNLAYCSPSDLHNFAVPGTKLFLALVADSSVLSFSYPWIYCIIFLINWFLQ